MAFGGSVRNFRSILRRRSSCGGHSPRDLAASGSIRDFDIERSAWIWRSSWPNASGRGQRTETPPTGSALETAAATCCPETDSAAARRSIAVPNQTDEPTRTLTAAGWPSPRPMDARFQWRTRDTVWLDALDCRRLLQPDEPRKKPLWTRLTVRCAQSAPSLDVSTEVEDTETLRTRSSQTVPHDQTTERLHLRAIDARS